MSAPKITLRPPPNVEFVQGYPGIPPAAPDRPLAGVKGTLEVRVGAQGVKAKWVRVELRKVETLPGGGQANTFFDFIGPSPINIWAADDREEWKELQTQDFPFFIRIPESIPPSIALERNAGIKYELIATICMKGKKGLFRRSKTPILSTSTPIVIDKHELHSTWPIYSQPDSRHVVTDALTLTVDRTHTCYGPGDRITVVVTIRNDNITTVTVRALEFMLKETIIFRSGAHASGKKAAPQVRTTIIGEQKVPVNLTLYGGTQHRAELATMVPQGHTTTTVTAARHIDITYSIVVNAVFPAGKPLLMELPVTISNWPRGMSIEAVKRIGPTPNLSLLTPHQLHMHTQPIIPPSTPGAHAPVSNVVPSSEKKRPGSSGGVSPGIPQNLLPGGGQGLGQSHIRTSASHQLRPYSIAERVAQHSSVEKPTSLLNNTMPIAYSSNSAANVSVNRRGFDEFGYAQGGASASPQATTVHGYPARPNQAPANNTNEPSRQRSANAVNPANRFAVTNISPDAEDSDHGAPSAVINAQTAATRYPTAAEEKKRLQQQLNPQPTTVAGGSSSAAPVRPSSPPRQTSPAQRSWPTAEEEKARLYERARAQAESSQARLHGHMPSQSSSTDHGTPSNASYGGAPQARWETAEEEKTRLFEQARRAVEETHARAEEENVRLLRSSNDANVYSPMSHAHGASASHVTPVYAGPSMSVSTVSTSTAGYTPTRRTEGSASVGAQLYSTAMASVSRPAPPQTQSVQKASSSTATPAMMPSSVLGAGKGRATGSPPQAQRTVYPTAEEEKAALRYYEAKRAVERAQNMDYFVQGSSSTQEPVPDEPIAYDALYPSQPQPPAANGSTVNGHSSDAEPAIPSYQPPIQPFNSALSEKERLRRKYEEEEAAAANKTPSPPAVPASLPSSGAVASSSPSPPLYGTSPTSSRPVRSQPLPPVNAGGSRHLSAAEEKARLKAQFEAEEATASSSYAGPSGASASSYVSPAQYGSAYDSPPYAGPVSPQAQMPISPLANLNRSPSYATSTFQSTLSSPPPPPPLMPRPPARYIQETQEVDARVQGDDDMYVSDDDAEIPAVGNSVHAPQRSRSPMDLAGDYTEEVGSSVPPRPPKVPV